MHARLLIELMRRIPVLIVTPDGIPVTMVFPAWLGKLEDAEKHLTPLRSFGSPVADLVSEMPYLQLQSALDAAAPPGIRRYWKSGYFTELSDELLDIFIRNVAARHFTFNGCIVFSTYAVHQPGFMQMPQRLCIGRISGIVILSVNGSMHRMMRKIFPGRGISGRK